MLCFQTRGIVLDLIASPCLGGLEEQHAGRVGAVEVALGAPVDEHSVAWADGGVGGAGVGQRAALARRDDRLEGRPGGATSAHRVVEQGRVADLTRGDHLGDGRIIVDSKSGTSGRGRKLSQGSLFVEVNENFSAYGIGRAHRHLPEMEQELAAWGWADARVTFSPHLLPVNRGILSTIYVTLKPGWSVERLVETYQDAYAGEPFIHVLPAGKLASLALVTHTNRCAISFAQAGKDEFIVVSAVDNLLKGASGQALQCMNLMFGLDETVGLPG